jgi:ArsR family transcriptional regulator
MASSERERTQLAAFFRALADPTRLQILEVLSAQGPMFQKRLTLILGRSQPVVSRHLLYLSRHGIVEVRRDGRCSYWSLARLPDGVLEYLQGLAQGLASREGASPRSTALARACPGTAEAGAAG